VVEERANAEARRARRADVEVRKLEHNITQSKEYMKNYHEENKDKKKEYDKIYREKNAEKIKEYKKQYSLKKKEEKTQQNN
jgi:hypothetical protein